jgi:Asp-tRNA(Asn)/Glu-tRNA(Gln) amidotransferase A subunit family amidase
MDYLFLLKVRIPWILSKLDQFRVEGIETSMCYIGWLGNIETSDSVFTAILRKLGAVFYGITLLKETNKSKLQYLKV